MAFSFKGIDHVQITAPKGAEAADILGCEEIEKPESLSHFDSLWFDVGKHILHVGLDDVFHEEKRGHTAFEIENIDELINHLEAKNVPFEEDFNLPGARRFYTYAFFGLRMEFLEWFDKPDVFNMENK